jgi:aspartate 1-decarboxylase
MLQIGRGLRAAGGAGKQSLSAMRRTFLKSKIHRAVVTDADLDHESSVTIDENLLEVELEESEAGSFKPTVVLVDAHNRIVARNALEVAGPARRVWA